MVPISLIEKLKTIFNVISSSSFFFIALIISIILLILVIISLKKYKKVNTKLFIIAWLVIVILLIIKYHAFILALSDSFIENIFMAIYFPNLAIFTIVIIVSNISLFYSIIKKDRDMIYRIIQIVSAILINFLFILILDTIVKNNIDVYSQTEIYQNNNLFVLLECSMAIFTVNIALTFIIYIIKKLLKTKKTHNDNQAIKENSNIQASQIPVNQQFNQSISNIPSQSYIMPNTTSINNNITNNSLSEAIIVPDINNVNRTNNNLTINNNDIRPTNQAINYTGVINQVKNNAVIKQPTTQVSILDNSIQFNNNTTQQNGFTNRVENQQVNFVAPNSNNVQNINNNTTINKNQQNISPQNNQHYFIPDNNTSNNIEVL